MLSRYVLVAEAGIHIVMQGLGWPAEPLPPSHAKQNNRDKSCAEVRRRKAKCKSPFKRLDIRLVGRCEKFADCDDESPFFRSGRASIWPSLAVEATVAGQPQLVGEIRIQIGCRSVHGI